ncbi:MAG TPA: hypothetical protein VGU20_24090 [Stellaceae bacterium]|nr:hypothetical protein [Stellaceae bacterium]
MSRDASGGQKTTVPPISDVLPIAVRAYGVREGKKTIEWEFPSRGPSPWHLTLDIETTSDESQRPRIGAYQLREGDRLREHGLFFDPTALTAEESQILAQYAAAKRLRLMTLREFVDGIFVRFSYHCQATTIGFNLPFDLSRLAEAHSSARGKMRPGFSFATAPAGRNGPRIRVKHLSRRASLIEFSGVGQRLPRGQRKRRIVTPSRRPTFVDVSTLAAALLSRAFSLRGLAKELETPHQKLDAGEHGGALTAKYLDYALQDVQVTWECFTELRRRYADHRLGRTPIHRILSEASVGKAYLREMEIRPWREMQPDFPPDLIGKIMGTYFGGRTEVHLRRVVSQVLYCDFTSMYPTVSTLMRLWPFVIAKGITWRDATAETQKFLDRVALEDLQRSETWRRLHVIVQVKPEGDILPTRAKYGYDESRQNYTIGLNHLTSDEPLWCTLADCIASKLLFWRPPRILKAIAFEPGEPQHGLRPVAIAGNPDFVIDPLKDDLFKRLIELRMRTKGPGRYVLKLIANATGYGIFVQVDVNERGEVVPIRCYPATGRPFLVDMKKVEEPGEFFHPLLGTLITSAARLMLAIAERLVDDSGLSWAFCDTDSMGIAKPEGMPDTDFFEKAQAVRNWFKPLNPYNADVDLFKVEDANYRLSGGNLTNELEPLFCFAVSSKRYALFNIDRAGHPIIRKATAHGLGHLLPPYEDEDAPSDLPRPAISLDEIGVRRWQHDVWHCIVRAALAGDPDHPDFSKLPKFDQPAASRYAVTTAHLAQWFDKFNGGRAYPEQVRPFNFMLMYHPDPLADWDGWRAANGLDPIGAGLKSPCIIAPYDKDLRSAVSRCFDRDTGKPVPASMLKTYRQALAQYHLRPETKFINADFLDRGLVSRRHVKVSAIQYIGKEANRWEEQSYLGIDPEAEIFYGAPPQDVSGEMAQVKKGADRHASAVLARAAQVSRQHLHAIISGDAIPSEAVVKRLLQAAMALDLAENSYLREADALLSQVKTIGVRQCAMRCGMDAGNLSRFVSGERKLTRRAFEKLKRALTITDQRTSGADGTEMQGK